MSSSSPRSDPGTYALHLRAEVEKAIQVGALGDMTVRPGRYVYVGSAFGPGGVRARVRRHVQGDGATHWHVDYLRAVTSLTRVQWTHDKARRECDWAAALRHWPGATVPLRGFGASDCDCPAHLFRIANAPPLDRFRARVRASAPDHAPIEHASGELLSGWANGRAPGTEERM